MTRFDQLNLKQEILEALNDMKFIEATEVQEKGIPIAMSGADVVIQSKTGTGKTGAFLIPILQNTRMREGLSSLIVLPTRELALQVYHVAKKMTSKSNMWPVVVYGGASIENQIRNLRKNPNMVVGTPGRIMDLMRRGELDISQLQYLILDEADIMLDLGFIEDVEFIMSQTPKDKQTMMFSATIPQDVEGLARNFMIKPQFLHVGAEEAKTVSTISHWYTLAAQSSKVPALLAYINEYKPDKTIIFSETKRNADFLYRVLIGQGFNATVIHGDLTQAQREKALSEFRHGARFMVATNVAARGLDITDVTDVINFDSPSEPNVYVHRVGRSARMGKLGSAFTIVREEDLDEIRRIEDEVGINMLRVELNQEPYRNISRQYSRRGRSNNSGRGDSRGGNRSGGRERNRGRPQNRRPGNSRNPQRSGNRRRW